MAPTSTAATLPRPRDPGLLGFLLLSLALHLVWLGLPAPRGAAVDSLPQLPALAVRLAQPALPQPAAGQPTAKPVQEARAGHAPTPAAVQPEGAAVAPATLEAQVPPQQHPRIDTATVFAAARLIARDFKPAPGPAANSALPTTVEAAVARAMRPEVVVESRGSNGEWVERRGKTRCVSSTHVPRYLEGQTVLTLCEVRKG